ncbi:MAG TPA: Mut7-C ubiquitin/RNAse domain-containing protein [Anaerolineae bacterium]|nr:Mut7-C ubiquitin/RNAse domain-containing protein [Anaerolineae bacterium]
MPSAQFRFYSELNDFLPRYKRYKYNHLTFNGRQTVKHLIESIGVPHTEVDLILVNGKSDDFSYLVQNGDVISVYPIFESFDISAENKLRSEPLREPKFVLDTHLGRLAAYLRLLGFDTLYHNDYVDQVLAEISYKEKRICLTRDRGLLKRNLITHGYCLRSTDSRQQVKEVLRRFDLFRITKPFQRCVRCNGMLENVKKEEIVDQIMPQTRRYYDEFKRCTECGQIYWKGSHFQRMTCFIESVLAEETRGISSS